MILDWKMGEGGIYPLMIAGLLYIVLNRVMLFLSVCV